MKNNFGWSKLEEKIILHRKNLSRNCNKLISQKDSIIRLATKFSVPALLKPFCVSIIITDLDNLPDNCIDDEGIMFDGTSYKYPTKYDAFPKERLLLSLRVFKIMPNMYDSLPESVKTLAELKNNRYVFKVACLSIKKGE